MSKSGPNDKPRRAWPDLLLHALVVIAGAVFATVILILLGGHARGGWGWLVTLAVAWPISFGTFYLLVVFASVGVNCLFTRMARRFRETRH